MKSIQSNIKKAKKYLDKNDCIAVPTETVYSWQKKRKKNYESNITQNIRGNFA